jgi:hypothetical protein
VSASLSAVGSGRKTKGSHHQRAKYKNVLDVMEKSRLVDDIRNASTKYAMIMNMFPEILTKTLPSEETINKKLRQKLYQLTNPLRPSKLPKRDQEIAVVIFMIIEKYFGQEAADAAVAPNGFDRFSEVLSEKRGKFEDGVGEEEDWVGEEEDWAGEE